MCSRTGDSEPDGRRVVSIQESQMETQQVLKCLNVTAVVFILITYFFGFIVCLNKSEYFGNNLVYYIPDRSSAYDYPKLTSVKSP